MDPARRCGCCRMILSLSLISLLALCILRIRSLSGIIIAFVVIVGAANNGVEKTEVTATPHCTVVTKTLGEPSAKNDGLPMSVGMVEAEDVQ